jgi:hypothetical protein
MTGPLATQPLPRGVPGPELRLHTALATCPVHRLLWPANVPPPRDFCWRTEYGRAVGTASPAAVGRYWRDTARTLLRLVWRIVPRRVRRYLAKRFSDVTPSEANGYAVWSAMGVVVGVPEIWAALAGSEFLWPTISTTVGHLQDRWPVVALIPVALIVISAYSLFRVDASSPAIQADRNALARTPEGRLARQEVTIAELASGEPPLGGRRRWNVLPYFLLATAAVVGAALLASRSDNRFLVGYVLYSLIAVVWIIVPNLAAYWFRRDVPYTTLFFTIRCLSRRLQLVAAFIAALLVILLLHLAFYPWPSP